LQDASGYRPTDEQQQPPVRHAVKNDKLLRELLTSIIPRGTQFQKSEFHGNVKWCPEEVAIQAMVWSWQEATNVTDAFRQSLEIFEDLKLEGTIGTYTGFMEALTRYRELFHDRVCDRIQMLAEEVVGEQFRLAGWLLVGFDGSRISATRTQSNEQALCGPNYGKGKEAKYGKKKCKGMRRKRNKENPPHPPKPQAWVTMMFDMSFRIPLMWQLGPSNASERDHVKGHAPGEKVQRKDTVLRRCRLRRLSAMERHSERGPELSGACRSECGTAEQTCRYRGVRWW
jgi:hypothetical protein